MDERDLTRRGREPFGPLQPGLWGRVLRGCQWGLTIITVICMWPGMMLALTSLTALLTDKSPGLNTQLINAGWSLWGLLLAVTALRLSGQGYRWWGFFPNALAWAALESRVYLDPWDVEGRFIVQLMAAVVAAQCLLHALWSLSEWLLARGRRRENACG